MNILLNVKGMECTGCENRIKMALSSLKEVKEVKPSYIDGTVEVILKNNDNDIKNKIIKIIEDLDFEVEK